MKLSKKLGFFSAFSLPLMLLVGYYVGGAGNYLTVFFVFGIIPILDHYIGTDTENIEAEKEKALSQESFFKFVLYSWVFIQLSILIWAMSVISADVLVWWEAIGFTISLGLVTGGVGITVAHELGHKTDKLDQFFAKVLLFTVGYMHFFIEHNRGHHVWVATPHDAATSQKNETFYHFWKRSIVNSYTHAWKLENERLERKNISKSSSENAMIWYTVLPIVGLIVSTLYFSIYKGSFAWEVPVLLIFQAIIGFSLLEAVNYVEHYGIVRKEIAPNRYERVNPFHSWNSSHKVSNFILFQLQRHSDHHAFAVREYQVLRHFDESPQLPSGYPTMILMALVPNLWFRKMNPILEHWKEAVYQKAS